MDALRKLHNNCKRELINTWVQWGETVLDCGCGRGGDWHKWKAVGARVFAIDPDEESLREAEQRAHEMNIGVWFLGQGSIIQAAFAGPYDVVCYNFSLHYIFEDLETYANSIKALALAVKPGGHLIGIVPDKKRATRMSDKYGHFKDKLGNEFAVVQGGRKLIVRLVGGPFYADGGREEPSLDPDVFIADIEEVGFKKILWEPMLPSPSGLISDLYSKFVFKKLS
jgi:SAM-dependent methyltransferase